MFLQFRKSCFLDLHSKSSVWIASLIVLIGFQGGIRPNPWNPRWLKYDITRDCHMENDFFIDEVLKDSSRFCTLSNILLKHGLVILFL